MINSLHKFHHTRFVLTFFIVFLYLISIAAVSAATRNPVADFDGDGKTDISVFRPSNGFWYVSKSSGGFLFVPWGISTDTPVPGDYDGDGKFDLAVFRQPERDAWTWYILRSSDNSFTAVRYGGFIIGDVSTALPLDYDGDQHTDLGLYRRTVDAIGASSVFTRLSLPTNRYFDQKWGNATDRPTPADYDGDGKADSAVYRNGIWYISQSSDNQVRIENFGLSTDKIVPADYDGDGKADIAVWRPSNGFWYYLSSRDKSFNSIQFGIAEDKPTPGDYDGDGKTDFAVFRPSNGVWYLLQTKDGFRAEQFGLSVDIPIPNVFVR